MDIVAYRGNLKVNSEDKKYKLEDFIKRLENKTPPEIDTHGNVKNLSIALFNAPKIDYRHHNMRDGIEGIGQGDIVLVDKKKFIEKGATFKYDRKLDFKNHALMSDISAKDVYELFKTSGVHFYYNPNLV